MRRRGDVIGVRVIVYVEPLMRRTKDEFSRAARDVEASIKRHVDDVDNTEVRFDHDADICSHCGGVWTEDADDYNGGCCDEDEAHNPEDPS